MPKANGGTEAPDEFLARHLRQENAGYLGEMPCFQLDLTLPRHLARLLDELDRVEQAQKPKTSDGG